MNDRDHVSEEELNAYVDDELPADRRGVVEAWLSTHPDDAARVAAWRKQAELLCHRYGHLEYEMPPPRFSLDRLSRRRFGALAAVAASLAAFMIGVAAGWTVHGMETEKPSDLVRFTNDALLAYRLYTVEVRHPVEVTGDQRPHLVQWLSKRLGAPVQAPELDKQGLKLVGGRLRPDRLRSSCMRTHPASASRSIVGTSVTERRHCVIRAAVRTPLIIGSIRIWPMC
jgi:anti-sigma factor RsiW